MVREGNNEVIFAALAGQHFGMTRERKGTVSEFKPLLILYQFGDANR